MSKSMIRVLWDAAFLDRLIRHFLLGPITFELVILKISGVQMLSYAGSATFKIGRAKICIARCYACRSARRNVAVSLLAVAAKLNGGTRSKEGWGIKEARFWKSHLDRGLRREFRFRRASWSVQYCRCIMKVSARRFSSSQLMWLDRCEWLRKAQWKIYCKGCRSTENVKSAWNMNRIRDCNVRKSRQSVAATYEKIVFEKKKDWICPLTLFQRIRLQQRNIIILLSPLFIWNFARTLTGQKDQTYLYSIFLGIGTKWLLLIWAPFIFINLEK